MLLHLSDLHFGTEKLACMAAIRKFCAENSIEVIAVSGDLTQRARLAQFYACKQFLDSLNVPYIVVPGNHDIPLYAFWKRALKPFYSYQLFFGRLEDVLQTEHFYLLGLNSIRRRYHTKGHISLQQVQQINAKLKAAPQHKYKVLLAHQPFYTSPNDRHGTKDCPVLGKMALEIWSQSGLNAVLHGHLHQSAVHDLNQIYHLNAQHPVLAIQAGTATSYRLHQGLPNSLNTISPTGDVQHYYFDALQQCFMRGAAHTQD